MIASSRIWLAVVCAMVCGLSGRPLAAQSEDAPRDAEQRAQAIELAPEVARQLAEKLSADWESPPEWVAMLQTLLRDKMPRYGEAWYSPSRRRHDWDWLVSRYDANDDQKIALEEFPAVAKRELWFRRLDQDFDELLTPADFKPPRFRPKSQPPAPDSSDDASQDADDGQAGEQTRRAPPPPTTGQMIKMLLNEELGDLTDGPELNAVAPPCLLPSRAGGLPIDIASFRQKQPVVLIFGSFT